MRINKIRWAEVITHEESRQHLQFLSIFIIMACISALMTVMNYFTGWRGALMYATLIFSGLNIINALLELLGGDIIRKIPRVLFAVETISLFTFFVINGQPKGFSTLWAALLPACGLLLYKGVIGSVIAGVELVILIFLFYLPAGQHLLCFDYNDVFMMRFPVLYATFFVVGLFFEIVRHFTQKELSTARDEYQELYAKAEELANKEKEVNYKILHILADQFSVVLNVDVETGKVNVYSGQNHINPALHGLSFFNAMTFYRNNWVSAEYRDNFGQFFKKENIVKRLETENSALFTYAAILNGQEHYIQVKIIKLPEENGSVNQIIITFSDTDAFVRQQQQIQEELRTQRQLAESASKAKSDYLFNISHDIRTPMNAILGFTDIASKNADNPEVVRDSLKKINLSGNMLLSLVNNFLDMSRIESGNVKIETSRADIGAIFENVKSVMSNQAASKHIDLGFDIKGVRDRYVYADVQRVERILMNLVSNAIKYTDNNGQAHLSCEQIDGDKPGYAVYRFSVRDNGIGMSDEFQKQMFDDFAREENSATRKIQGAGLGLPLAKKLAELMEGTITCESKQGIGSTFYLTLPLKQLSLKDVQDEKIVEHHNATVDLSGKRVLLVEDNDLNREIAKYILEEKGMVVEDAANGKIAVEMIEDKGPKYYYLVLMDINMPVMDGYKATMEIRKFYNRYELPIVALSANAFEEDRKKSFESGMNGHLSKPIDIETLTKVLAKYCI